MILQPQGAEAQVRKELLHQGWKLKDECLVEEDSITYTILNFSQLEGYSRKDIELKTNQLTGELIASISPAGYDLSACNRDIQGKILIQYIWQLGPLLILNKNKQLVGIVEKIIEQKFGIITEMNNTDRFEIQQKAKHLQVEIKTLEGLREWLFQ